MTTYQKVWWLAYVQWDTFLLTKSVCNSVMFKRISENKLSSETFWLAPVVLRMPEALALLLPWNETTTFALRMIEHLVETSASFFKLSWFSDIILYTHWYKTQLRSSLLECDVSFMYAWRIVSYLPLICDHNCKLCATIIHSFVIKQPLLRPSPLYVDRNVFMWGRTFYTLVLTPQTSKTVL